MSGKFDLKQAVHFSYRCIACTRVCSNIAQLEKHQREDHPNYIWPHSYREPLMAARIVPQAQPEAEDPFWQKDMVQTWMNALPVHNQCVDVDTGKDVVDVLPLAHHRDPLHHCRFEKNWECLGCGEKFFTQKGCFQHIDECLLRFKNDFMNV